VATSPAVGDSTSVCRSPSRSDEEKDQVGMSGIDKPEKEEKTECLLPRRYDESTATGLHLQTRFRGREKGASGPTRRLPYRLPSERQCRLQKEAMWRLYSTRRCSMHLAEYLLSTTRYGHASYPSGCGRAAFPLPDGESIQDRESGLPRIPIFPRSLVNRVWR
jgi:hypothetical protein